MSMMDSFLPDQSRRGAEALEPSGRHDRDALDIDADTEVTEHAAAVDSSDDGVPPPLPTSYVRPAVTPLNPADAPSPDDPAAMQIPRRD